MKALTRRERQVIALLLEGKTNKAIASELRLSAGTIREYLTKLFQKTGIEGRVALAVWAYRNPAALADLWPNTSAVDQEQDAPVVPHYARALFSSDLKSST